MEQTGRRELGTAVAPAARGMGDRGGAPPAAAVDRQDRGRAPRPTLPAYDPTCYLCPGNARVGGHGQPALRDHVRVRQRSSVRGRGRAARRRRPAPALPRVARRRRRARRVLLAAPRFDAGRDAGGGDRRGRRRVAQPDARAGRAPGGAPGAVLREQGRRRRRLQPAPARPDLRDVVRVEDVRDRARARRSATSATPAAG